MIELSGRRVLVTGGDRGIGGACSLLFARCGAAVLVHYREREETARALLDQLRRISDAPHLAFRADLADADQIGELFNQARQQWGSLDCLVNNAGVWVRNPLERLDLRLLEETWRVNVTAPFLCARQALPLFAKSADANIVNLSSTAGQRGEAFYSPYAASKGALIAATKAWSTELAPRVRVNAVAPGWVDTEMSAAALRGDPAQRRAIEATIPLQRVASPEDVAGPVLFLASPLARHITGEILNVNGGSVLVGS